MTAHKHAEMIKAKADNMDLVVFVKRFPHWEMDDRLPPSAQDIKERWFLAVDLQWEEDAEYFLCLPQHKEACLHWLNGGLTQVKYDGEDWKDVFNSENPSWQGCNYFMMRDYVDYRIKPRKEKRWIGFSSKSNIVTGMSFSTKESLSEYVNQNFAYPEYVQAIEIEIEV